MAAIQEVAESAPSTNCWIIKERMQRNPRVSMKSAVREIGVSDRLVRRMAKEKLKLKAYKLQKV